MNSKFIFVASLASYQDVITMSKRKHSSEGSSTTEPQKKKHKKSLGSSASVTIVSTEFDIQSAVSRKRPRTSSATSSSLTTPIHNAPKRLKLSTTPNAEDETTAPPTRRKRNAVVADLVESDVEAQDQSADLAFVSPFKAIFQGEPNQSVARKRRCVQNHYEQFFQDHTRQSKSWDCMSATDFSLDNVGSFATYLVQKTGINSIDTATGYLSSVRGLIEVHKNGGRHHEVCTDDRTWTKINEQVKNALVRKAKKNNKVTLKKRAVPATLTKMNKLQKHLLQIGTRKSIHDRFLFGMQFAIMGRPYELDFLQYQHLCMSEEDDKSTVAVVVLRTKILAEQSLHVFAAPIGKEYIDYACCILHCMFTYFLIYTPIGVSAVDKLFECSMPTISTNMDAVTELDGDEDDPNIGTNTVARYMNRALLSYCADLQPKPPTVIGTDSSVLLTEASSTQSCSTSCPVNKAPNKNQLTSYSCRRGAVEVAARNSQIDDVARRAGQQQSLEERKTIYEYITGTPEGDAEVGAYKYIHFYSNSCH
jgi:hypothetical protein